MAKVGTSNPDRTISLKAAVRICINKQKNEENIMKSHSRYSSVLAGFQVCCPVNRSRDCYRLK